MEAMINYLKMHLNTEGELHLDKDLTKVLFNYLEARKNIDTELKDVLDEGQLMLDKLNTVK